MSWFPVLDQAAQYWQGTRVLPRDYDVLDRLRKAISDMPAEMTPEEPETPYQPATETEGERRIVGCEKDCRLQEVAKAQECGWEKGPLQLSEIASRELEEAGEAAFQPWKPDEDRLLMTLHSKLGPDWVSISNHMPSRSPPSLEKRFSLLSPSGQSTKTASADQSLAKQQQIQLLRQNAGRLEEKLKRFKEELGRLEDDLNASQF